MLDAEISRSLVRATSESLYDYCFMQSERQKESSSFKSPVELIERKRETDALLIDLRTQVDALESDIAYDQQDINVMKRELDVLQDQISMLDRQLSVSEDLMTQLLLFMRQMLVNVIISAVAYRIYLFINGK